MNKDKLIKSYLNIISEQTAEFEDIDAITNEAPSFTMTDEMKKLAGGLQTLLDSNPEFT